MKSHSSGDTTAKMGVCRNDKSYMDPKFQEMMSVGRRLAKYQLSNNSLDTEKDGETKSLSSELYKRRTTVFISRDKFLDVVCDGLSEYKYVGPNQRADLILACRYSYNLKQV